MKSAAPIIQLKKSQTWRENCSINLSLWILNFSFNLHPIEQCFSKASTHPLGVVCWENGKPEDKHGILLNSFIHSTNIYQVSTLCQVLRRLWGFSNEEVSHSSRSLWCLWNSAVTMIVKQWSHKSGHSVDLYLKIWWKSQLSGNKQIFFTTYFTLRNVHFFYHIILYINYFF